MKVFADKEIRTTILLSECVVGMLFAVTEFILYKISDRFSLAVVIAFLAAALFLFLIYYRYVHKRERLIGEATKKIELFLDGDNEARIDSNEEGGLYILFQQINMLESNLTGKILREGNEKLFLKNMISDISHQLKTPIAALSIYNGILKDTDEIDAVKEFADKSEMEIDRIESLVQSLLKLTKLDSGTIVLNKNKESIGDIIDEVRAHFDFRAKNEQKELTVEMCNDFCINCDREWMIEALENLVKNALDHTKEGDIVSIKIKHPGENMAVIEVSDTGCGIHPEDLYHIFKRFYRSRFSSDTSGLGLGLALTKSIVEAHGGIIEAESELGKGSSFIINLTEL